MNNRKDMKILFDIMFLITQGLYQERSEDQGETGLRGAILKKIHYKLQRCDKKKGRLYACRGDKLWEGKSMGQT